LQSYCAKEAKRAWEDGSLDVDDLLNKIHKIWPLDVDAGDQTHVAESVRRIITMHRADVGEEKREMIELANEIDDIAQNVQRDASVSQRCLMRDHHIEMRVFSLLRQDVITLWQLFDKLADQVSEDGLTDDEEDEEHERQLNKRDALYLLTELGTIPKQVPVLQQLLESARDKVDTACPCNFEGFLQLIIDIEEVLEPIIEWYCRHLDRIFEEFHIDDEFEVAPYVTLEDLPHIFEKAGLPVDEAIARPAVRRVMSDADMEGRGRIMVTSVKSLYNLTKKRIQQLQLLSEFAAAEGFNFTTREFREMHTVFGSLDIDGSGSLEMHEVQKAVEMLKLDLKWESRFVVAFEMLDADGSGALDFQEFMRFLKMVRDKEGAFKEAEKTVVSTLKDLDRMDLIRLLDAMKKPGDDFDGATIEAMMKEASSRLEISSSMSLASAFNVSTLEDLYIYARLHRH